MTTSVQKPTIGHIVLFWVMDPGECAPNPAIITFVHDDGSVDLHLFGKVHSTQVVVPSNHWHNVRYSDAPAIKMWSWPPRV